MIKLLITSGCSFSQVPNINTSWPAPLSKALNIETEYHGRGACGNGIISRTIVHAVSNALKKHNPEEILVGIMWSGFDRLEIYNESPSLDINPITLHSPYYGNPQWIADQSNSNYIIMNSHWNDEFTETYMKNFYDTNWGIMLTLEHILRVQWFLKLNNIKYFMTHYGNDLIAIKKYALRNPDIRYLYNLIDFDEWLSVNDMDEWARQTKLPYLSEGDYHPSTEMHQLFVDSVILPHLKSKGIIN